MAPEMNEKLDERALSLIRPACGEYADQIWERIREEVVDGLTESIPDTGPADASDEDLAVAIGRRISSGLLLRAW